MTRPAALTLALSLALTAQTAAAETVHFCWTGANGYTMTGRMDVPDRLMSNAVLTEDHIDAFKIAGYRNGQLLGTWDMTQAGRGTTFHLRFDPVGMRFLTGGSYPSTYSQGWNADGTVEDCGEGGFGFNSGNYAQDVCLNGTWLADSSIDPATPLIAGLQPVDATCSTVQMMSKSAKPNHFD